MVEIDYDSLRRKQQPSSRTAVKHPESDQEVYDDVGDQDSISTYVYGINEKETIIKHSHLRQGEFYNKTVSCHEKTAIYVINI